jgi:hypothetical protein
MAKSLPVFDSRYENEILGLARSKAHLNNQEKIIKKNVQIQGRLL